jgi:hypothetical protein
MRTKTLLLTAALSAVGLTASLAQSVFSVNAVGYVNKTFNPGFTMIANPLVGADNTVLALFPTPPEGTTIYKFVDGAYMINAYEFEEWALPGMTLTPGEGAFLLIPPGDPYDVTFVGEVKQGDLSHPVPAGLSMQSSEVPQAGVVDEDLGFPVAPGDLVYIFHNDTQNYVIHTYDEFDEVWSTVPTVEVGESFFTLKGAATDWTRMFSVNTSN